MALMTRPGPDTGLTNVHPHLKDPLNWDAHGGNEPDLFENRSSIRALFTGMFPNPWAV